MVLKLTERQNKLLEFVKECHSGQVRKYTNEPYWKHPLAVAEIVSEYYPEGVEAALCHDLFEDTDCTIMQLISKLCILGYSDEECDVIICQTLDLTNDFPTKKFPHLKRSIRKDMECERLSSIAESSQTIKYADIIHNSSSIVKYDVKFAKLYLKEAISILNVMDKGNKQLFNKCKNIVLTNLKQITEPNEIIL